MICSKNEYFTKFLKIQALFFLQFPLFVRTCGDALSVGVRDTFHFSPDTDVQSSPMCTVWKRTKIYTSNSFRSSSLDCSPETISTSVLPHHAKEIVYFSALCRKNMLSGRHYTLYERPLLHTYLGSLRLSSLNL